MTCVWAPEEAELTVAKRILAMCVALIFYQNVFRAVFVVAAVAAAAAMIAFVVVFFIDKVFLSYDSPGQVCCSCNALAQISFGTACTPVRMRNAILN